MSQNQKTDLPNRKSIRLKNYDYSEPGDYFITICTYDRGFLFGEVVNGEMILNDVGKMVEKWLLKLAVNFPNISLDISIIMPNHIHIILSILCKEDDCCSNTKNQVTVGEAPCLTAEVEGGLLNQNPNDGRAHGPAPTMPDIIAWFKTMTTNKYIRNVKNKNWKPFNKYIWQRSFHDHIIHNQKSYDEIYSYIESNPQTWSRDRNNPLNFDK